MVAIAVTETASRWPASGEPTAESKSSMAERQQGAARAESIRVRLIGSGEALPAQWDRFVAASRSASAYHLAGWRSVISGAYGKQTYYLAAELWSAVGAGADRDADIAGAQGAETKQGGIVGVLPLVHMRHWLFGNSLVSIPFFDGGGVLTEDPAVAELLCSRSVELASELGAGLIELRQGHPLDQDRCLLSREHSSGPTRSASGAPWKIVQERETRVRMVLDLPEDPDLLMRRFKAKLRSQIHKPMKEGLSAVVGGVELLGDFYCVFSENMRDLGSPVHSRSLIEKTLLGFPETARLFVVYGKGLPLAASLTVGFGTTLLNPWASSLRRFRDLAPNMLLYWSMLEFACRNGFSTFDFGRSHMGEGTFRFKEQWGAKPMAMAWYRIVRDEARVGNVPDRDRLAIAVALWKRLPVPITRMLGPKIRAGISL